MELELIIKQRQALKDEQDEIKAEIDDLNNRIASILEAEGLSKINVGHWTVTANRAKRFNASIAKQIVDKKKMPKALRETLYKAAEYDPNKLKAMFPEEWEAARVADTRATVTIREVKP